MSARLGILYGCMVLLLAGSARAQVPVEAVLKVVAPGTPKSAATPAKADDKNKGDDEEEVVEPAPPKAPENPREFKFSLRDGSVITGELSLEQMVVETEFGPLTIPVAKIRSFTPGLNASPALAGKITSLIDALGGDDYKAREQAHKDLAKMGPSIRKELELRTKDDNAERRRHLTDLLKELEQQEDERDSNENDKTNAPLLRGDLVVTPEFTVVGKIVAQEFKINTKFGSLALSLGDLRCGEKEAPEREGVRRTLTVEGANLAQTGYKTSGVKVEKGDRITLKADGNIVMSPWGSESQSSPEGGANYGWFIPNQIPGGALVVRIGSNGKPMKAGSSKTWVAENAGVLEFAIGMQAQYANPSYSFPGAYNVRIKVDPR